MRTCSNSDAYVSCPSPIAEAGRIYFRSGKEIIHWCPATGIFGTIHGHALPIKCIAAGNGYIYSVDDSSILCWSSSTHIKLAETSVKNTALIWAHGDILVTIGVQSIRSYKLSGATLSLLHEIPLAPQIALGAIISAAVMWKNISYNYFLVMQTEDEHSTDNYIYTWTIEEPFDHIANKSQATVTMDNVFPQFTTHVERTDLPLLTSSELVTARAKHMHHLSTQEDCIIREQSSPTVEVLNNKVPLPSSRQLPGTKGHAILDIKTLSSNHILCVCTGVLYLYDCSWSIVNRKDVLDDTILASYIHSNNNYLVLGYRSGRVSIYDCVSFAHITTLDLRQFVRINGTILTVALLELDGYPNIFIVFRIGAVFLGDVVSRSVVPCLGLCTHTVHIVPFRNLCLAISGTTTLGIVAFQTIFNPKVHIYVPKSFVLESTFHGPCLDFIVDLYYQHYACIVTDTHLILLESIISRSNDFGTTDSHFNFKQVVQCANEKIMFDSSSYQSGCFVAGPITTLKSNPSQITLEFGCTESTPLWLCLLTNKELHLFSVPTIDNIATYTLSSNVDTCNKVDSFLACDRSAVHGDYLLLSGCHQKSVSILSTAAGPPHVRLCGTYPLASATLSCVAVHPSSIYAVIVHNTGIALYTLPDFTLISISAYARANEGEHTVYFDPMGAYFLVSTLSYKHNASTLTIYEFGTGSVHSSLDFDGKIKQIVFINDIHAFLSNDNGNIYELIYDNLMTSVIDDMEQHLRGLNNSITQLWASMDDVRWD